MTKIPWTEATWNPVVGCTKIAVGCKNCYAERMAKRFWKQWGLLAPPHHFGVKWFPERLDIPLHWRKPRKIFVCSMGDLFHEAVPFEFIDKVMAVITACPQHTFQILTKRPERMLEYYQSYEIRTLAQPKDFMPLPNLWRGTSISTQADADKNIPILLQIPAGVLFVSFEPMLERVDLMDVHPKIGLSQDVLTDFSEDTKKFNKDYAKHLKSPLVDDPRLDWVIIGCESGPKARLCSIEDIRDAVRQCKEAGVPVFVKQIPIGVSTGYLGATKCSKKPEEWPEDLRIQEYPNIQQ